MKKMSNATSSLLNAEKAKWDEGCTYVGSFFIFLTVSFMWYWGNFAVYTESYLRHSFGPDPEITEPWVPCLRMVGMGVGLIVAGYIARFIGRKCTLIAGCFLMDSVMFLTVFSLKRSLFFLNISLGLVGGLGAGFVFTLSLQHALSFQPKYQGLVTMFVISGTIIGAACFNQVITWFINPTNLTPDLYDGHQTYFTQMEVLERVPSTFVLLGSMYVGCHVVGIFLMRPNVKEEQKDWTPGENRVADAEGSHGKRELKENGRTSSTNVLESSETNGTFLTMDVSPRQMLTTRSFYLLWFGILISEYSYIVFINYYKIYGETQIPDDQFMAYLVTGNLLISFPMSSIWGGLVDACGVKFCLVVLFCITCVSSNFWYFTPMINRWLYFVWTIMLGCSTSAFYLVYPMATIKLFGKKHFSKNYGIVMSSSLFLNLFAPTVMQALVTGFGWFYLFISVGCVNAIALVLNVLWLPRT